ncbi:MAG: hypothetical protein LBI68_03030 [Azoarcus sp.]|jgi:hypothetical protein|nr:hypothetical protein [Azoarcus sp.]
MLPRDTGWQQGDLLTHEAAVQLHLIDAEDEGHHAVIITHDCDLRHKDETFVEIIIAEALANDAKPNAQFTYAKNPRRLHLIYECPKGEALALELRQNERRRVSKKDFAAHAKNNIASLSSNAKRTFKQWLAARYGRPAFPNAFEMRLRKRSGKYTVEQNISKILHPEAEYLVGLFFDLGEQRQAETDEGEPYALAISVVYDATEGSTRGRESAERVASQLQKLFEETYGTPDKATEIALDSCEAVADTHITLADLRRVDQWRLEYISLRDDGPSGFLPVGEIPA